MREPSFWWTGPENPGWQARLLTPVAHLWHAGRSRWARPDDQVRAQVPVVCVGALTPDASAISLVTAALAGRLAGRGVHVVLCGEMARAAAHRVDIARDTAAGVGDAALILAAVAPVWIARDRAAGVRAAEAAGAGLILLADGMQDRRVAVDLMILTVDAATAFGNGRLVPAGPLREPVAAGLARAGLVVLVGRPAERATAIAAWPALAGALPARLAVRETGLGLKGEPVVAFAGMRRPGRFFATLAAEGAEVVAAIPFPERATYPWAVLRRLKRRADAAGAMLVTTETDAVRLPAAFRSQVVVLQLHLEPENWRAIDQGFALL